MYGVLAEKKLALIDDRSYLKIKIDEPGFLVMNITIFHLW